MMLERAWGEGWVGRGEGESDGAGVVVDEMMAGRLENQNNSKTKKNGGRGREEGRQARRVNNKQKEAGHGLAPAW